MSARLMLLRDGTPVKVIPLGKSVVSVGRAPENDLVLGDETLSWRHAELWARGRAVYVRDRGSTNGTYLNDTRVSVPVPAADGDVVRLGDTVFLRVEGSELPGGVGVVWLVEDLATGVRTALKERRSETGEADRVELGEDGGVSLHVGTSVRTLEEGEVFQVAGARLRLVRAPAVPVPTAGSASGPLPYHLAARLDGPSGPEASIAHPARGQSLVISAENRAVLMYLLARKLSEDRRRGARPAAAGWCSDEELAIGIWGRDGASMPPNTLHVLLHRVRKDLEAAGFDTSFLEKRRGATRLVLSDVRVL